MIKLLSYQINKTVNSKRRIVKLRSGKKRSEFESFDELTKKRAELQARINADIYLHYQDASLTIVIMNGSGGCGKDTFVKMATKSLGYYKTSIIDYPKEVLGVTDKTIKSNEVRKRLSDYLDNNFNECFEVLIKKVKENARNIVFVDIRETDVIALFSYFCLMDLDTLPITVHVDKGTEKKGNHADDDTDTDKYEYDIYIDNNKTLDDLNDKAIKFRDKYLI